MKWCLVNNGFIDNIIIADEETAKSLGAETWYDGAAIGDIYTPPVVLTAEDDLMFMIIDQEYRLTLLELGVNK